MRFELGVIGASWGGIEALQVLLGSLPRGFPVPLAVVQHRDHQAEEMLTRLLQRSCALTVAEAEDKEPLRAGRVYIAPADYHMLIDDRAIALSIDPPVAYARPSIDLLFESAAEAYREHVVGVLLTGKNRDGVRGLEAIRRRGGLAVVQQPATAAAEMLPAAAVGAGAFDVVLHLEAIGPFLVTRCVMEKKGDLAV